MTFREKSLWITLCALLLSFGGLAWLTWQVQPHLPQTTDLGPAHAGLFAATTVVLVIILAVGHAVAALLDRRTEPDERDLAIERRAGHWGGFVLATGVFLALCTAVMTEGNALMAHVLLGFWVLAELVDTAAQLMLHRLGG